MRALPIVAAEAACRGILRRVLGHRRLESPFQHRPYTARSCRAAASEGISTRSFADALGTDSVMDTVGEIFTWRVAQAVRGRTCVLGQEDLRSNSRLDVED